MSNAVDQSSLGRSPLVPLAANGLRWLGLFAMLTGYAFVFPAGFAAFGLMAAVTSLALVAAEVAHLHLAGRGRE
jgi:hypothetical protein